MKKVFFLIFSFVFLYNSYSQTAPPAQTLPLSVNFGTTNFTPPFTGMTAWTGSGTRPYGTQAAAEASAEGADVAAGALFASNPASGGGGGQYGQTVSGNSRLTILGSSNATNGTSQTALAINTIGQSNITIAYSTVLSVANARDIGIVLQYRIGTTGAFTTIAGTAAVYNATSTIGGDADGPADFDNWSVILPAAAEGNAVVQLRWITWRGSQAGSSSGIGLDNIVIGNVGAPCTAPPDIATNLLFTTVTTSSVTGSFSPANANGYLIVRSTSSTLSAFPVDGTAYTAGASLGGGTVVTAGTTTGFTDNGLTAATQYYYFVFPYNDLSCSGGPVYNDTYPQPNNVTTSSISACTTPSAPTGINLTSTNTFISGTFTGSGANKYLTVISTSSALSLAPVNGTVYVPGQAFGNGTVVSYGPAASFTASGLTLNTHYYLYVFASNDACSGEPFYSTSLNGNIFTTNTSNGIPAGYYNAAAGLTCANLKTALSNIITSGQATLSYGNLDDIQMPIADTTRSDDGTHARIWDIYSDNAAGPEPFEFNASQNPVGGFCGGTSASTPGICWNKEHTFPQSWFGSALPAYADLFIVRPTDESLNSKRGNIPYSIVGGTTTYTFPTTAATYPGVPILDKIGPSTAAGVNATSAFEPANGIKGDIARNYFYILTRYQNNLASWTSTYSSTSIGTVVDGTTGGGLYPSFQLPYLTMMYNWHLADPVDAREIQFNNNVYSQQNNRNPYIDHPEYVAQVFQCTGVLPVTLIDFTAQKNTGYVLLKWYATFETSFRQYDVERSTDGIHFNKIGQVAGQNLANYAFPDNNLPKNSMLYYRLNMIDLDGRSRYSKIITIRLDNSFSDAVVFPNPTAGDLHIKLNEALQANSRLQITDITGRIVQQQSVSANELSIDIDIQKLSAGRYFIKILNNTQVINQSFVVIK